MPWYFIHSTFTESWTAYWEFSALIQVQLEFNSKMAPSAANGVDGNRENDVNGNHGVLQWDKFQNVVNGKLESTKETRYSINPATGEPNPKVPVATPDDVDRAVRAAEEAFVSWSKKATLIVRKLS